MENNIKVARAHRALSWLYGLLILLFAVMLILAGDGESPDGFYFALLLFSLVFALHHYTAKGSRERKPWARNTSRVIAVLMLTGFPVGTLIGIYLLYYSRGWDEIAAAGSTGS